MRSKKIFLLSILLLISVLLSACSSTIYASTSWHGLSVSQDNATAYLASGTQVYAVDVASGTQKWKFPDKANAKGFYANPVLTPDGQQLLVASYDNTLYSLDPSTGTPSTSPTLKWTFSGSSTRLIASPLVTQNMIFLASSDGYVYALDLTGKQVWKEPSSTPLGAFWSQPATDPKCNCIYVSSMDHHVYAFDITTGKQLWANPPDLNGAIVGTPAIGPDGTLYIGTFSKEMFALNAANGSILWRFTTQNWVWSGPALVNNVVYFGDLSGNFYALDATNGKVAWQIKPNNSIVDTPVVSGENIYFTTQADTLYVVSTAGVVVNSKVIGGVIYSSPIIAGDTILVAPTNFTNPLVALNLEGTQRWLFTPLK